MQQNVTFEPVEIPSRYAKAIVAILTAVVTVLAAALTDNYVTHMELAGIGIALLTAVAVYLIPNLPAGIGRWAKAIVAVIGTGLQALVPLLSSGELSTSGWLMVLVAALGAVSVGIVPNVEESDLTPVPEGWEPAHRAETEQ